MTTVAPWFRLRLPFCSLDFETPSSPKFEDFEEAQYDDQPMLYNLVSILFFSIVFLKQKIHFLNGPLPASFYVFSTRHKSNLNWQKHWWCAWDSNPRRKDGRHRQIHWAMAASLKIHFYTKWMSKVFVYYTRPGFEFTPLDDESTP